MNMKSINIRRMCVYGTKNDVPFIIIVVAFYMLCPNVHYTNAADTANRSLTFAKTQALKKSGGNPGTSSYFQRDPYGPNTYTFGFEVNDNRTGNVQFRDERRYSNGSVEGSFGYVRPDGRVMVTHYLSDNERGFLQDTRTFEAGDQQKWRAHWPTKRPDILYMQRPHDMANGAVVYDKDLHLNVTKSEMPAQTVSDIKDQHGIDVNVSGNANEDIGNTAVQDIIDGKVPLQAVPGKTESHIGFETVHDFLPPNFPIVPFKLPPMLAGADDGSGEGKGPEPENGGELKNKNAQKTYDKAKTNNAEKTLNVDKLPKSVNVTNETTAAESKITVGETKSNYNNNPNIVGKTLPLNEIPKDAENPNRTWYQQLIDETRNEYLNNLPDLQ